MNNIFCWVTQPLYFCQVIIRDVAQPGSALRSGRRGRRFESCHPDGSGFNPFQKARKCSPGGLFLFSPLQIISKNCILSVSFTLSAGDIYLWTHENLCKVFKTKKLRLPNLILMPIMASGSRDSNLRRNKICCEKALNEFLNHLNVSV